MTMLLATLGLAASILALYQLFRLLFPDKRTRLPLPPSPPREWLLGHYRSVPMDAAFKKYAQWAEEYGLTSIDPRSQDSSRSVVLTAG